MLRITKTRAFLFIKGTFFKNDVLKWKIARKDNKTIRFFVFLTPVRRIHSGGAQRPFLASVANK
jgi:hypothetical protein